MLSLFAFAGRAAVASIYLTLYFTARGTADDLRIPYAAGVALVAAYDYFNLRSKR